MKCDILSMEWGSSGRDIHITEPVLSYLEIKYNLIIVRESIWDGIWKIIKYRPKILLLSNTVGAHENFNMARIAFKLGIKVISLSSEGDYNVLDNEVHFSFWGWNYEKKFYEDLRLLWSERTKKLVIENIPESKNYSLNVSGGTGFDRYIFLPTESKISFLGRYNKGKYKKIITIAGYGLDRLSDDFLERVKNEKRLKDTIPETYLNNADLFRRSGIEFNLILKNLIETNLNILFILKYHPSNNKNVHIEFSGLDTFENVLSIWTEEDIHTVISISDILLAFDSTTCLEAWLLKKQTALINPCGTDFFRSKVSTGSPIYSSYDEVNTAIHSYYAGNNLIGYDELLRQREFILKDIIEYSDGLNHVRAGEKICKVLLSNDGVRHREIDIPLFGLIFKELLRLIVFNTPLGLFKPNSFQFIKKAKRKYRQDERNMSRDSYKKALLEFYKQMHSVLIHAND